MPGTFTLEFFTSIISHVAVSDGILTLLLHFLSWNRYQIWFFFSFTLYPAGRIVGRGAEKETCVKTLLLSVVFWRHCALSGGSQWLAYASTQERKMKIFYICNFLEWDSNPQLVLLTVTFLCSCTTTDLNMYTYIG